MTRAPLLFIEVQDTTKGSAQALKPACRAALRSHVMLVHMERRRKSLKTAKSTGDEEKLLGHDLQRIATYTRTMPYDISNLSRTQLPHGPELDPIFRHGTVALWVDNFLPITCLQSSKPIETLEVWDAPLSSAMYASNDAIGLFTYGAVMNDPVVLYEGRKRQVAAIKALRIELAKKEMNMEAVFCTAINLILCELWRPSSADARSLDTYIAGMNTVASVFRDRRGESTASTPFFDHSRHLTLFYSLMRRTRMPLGNKFWTHSSAPPGGREALMQIAVGIPDLLETVDQMCGSPADDMAAILYTRMQLIQLSEDMKRWRKDYQSSASSLPVLASFLDGGPLGTVLRPATSPHRFANYLDGCLLSCYWCFQLAVQQALYDLGANTNSTIPNHLNNTARQQADYYADMLCSAVPHLLEMSGAPISQTLTVRAPLHFASRCAEKPKLDCGRS
ncbi:Hypothetical protein D9617_18g032980 [Elsinoe fawcettii]|nr:Hypothetical protein D9617_18g032980 [Elsinoe fawcettii]